MRHTLIIALFTFFLLFTRSVFAEDFVLTQIGALSTQGKVLNHWYYEPQRVVLKGSGSRGANIDVTVDGKFAVTKAGVDNGLWSFDLGTLEKADHTITVASGDQSHSFILTIGSAPPADMSGTKGGLPATGGILPLIGLVSVAGVLIYFGVKKSEA